MALSIRQMIVDNVVKTLTSEGVVPKAVDARPAGPDELEKEATAAGFAWVFEGEEEPDEGQMDSKIVCRLPLFVQVAFRFDSSQPSRRVDRLGRELFARLTRAMHRDISRGTDGNGTQLVVQTIETGNMIGELDGVSNVAVLDTNWEILYHRDRNDPYKL